MGAGAKAQEVPYPEHPDRCQASGAFGRGRLGPDKVKHYEQCMNFATAGSKYCIIHAGNKEAETAQKKELNLYRLTQFQARVDELIQGGQASGTNSVLGLRSEIGILRMKLESIINLCKSSSDLLIHSQKINMTVQLIGKLVVDAKKLESSLGHLLDRSTVNSLCDNIVATVAKYVEDADKIEAIAKEIGAAVETAVLQRANQEAE